MLRPLYPWLCWPKINRLPAISPAKTGLFVVSRELPFGICSHVEPRARTIAYSPTPIPLPHATSEEGEHFHGGKGHWKGYNKQGPWLFIGWVLARKEKSPSFWALISLQEMRAPLWSPSPFNCFLQLLCQSMRLPCSISIGRL